MPLGNQKALYTELVAFMIAVEVMVHKGWFPIWFESDSEILVTKVRTRSMDLSWRLRSRWRKCLQLLSDRVYRISHFYREGNAVENAMANEGFNLDDFTWWYDVTDKS